MSSFVGKLVMHNSGKGPYLVSAVGVATKDLRKMVVYEQLYDHPQYPKGTVWVRDLDEFEGDVESGGKIVPRFSLAK